jgi:hypothetical protein
MQPVLSISELYEKLAALGWRVKNVSFKSGRYVAKGEGPGKIKLERVGGSAEMAVAALYTAAIRATDVRRIGSFSVLNWKEVADEYASLPILDEKAVPAWRALASEAKILAKQIGQQVQIEVTPNEVPYTNARELHEDVQQQRHAFISSANTSHPVWGSDDQIAFRTVSEVLGRAYADADYSWVGANATFEALKPVLSDLAQQAAYVEIVGQAAAHRTYGHAEPKVAYLDEQLGQKTSMAQLDDRQLKICKRHCAELQRDLGISVSAWDDLDEDEGYAEMGRTGWKDVITVPPLTTDVAYFTWLHEMGHIVFHRYTDAEDPTTGWINDTNIATNPHALDYEEEAWVWNWTKQIARIPLTSEIIRSVNESLETYHEALVAWHNDDTEPSYGPAAQQFQTDWQMTSAAKCHHCDQPAVVTINFGDERGEIPVCLRHEVHEVGIQRLEDDERPAYTRKQASHPRQLTGLSQVADVINSAAQMVLPGEAGAAFDSWLFEEDYPELRTALFTLTDYPLSRLDLSRHENDRDEGYLSGLGEAVVSGDTPPIVVVEGEGPPMLIDGNHRAVQALQQGLTSLPAYIARIQRTARTADLRNQRKAVKELERFWDRIKWHEQRKAERFGFRAASFAFAKQETLQKFLDSKDKEGKMKLGPLGWHKFRQEVLKTHQKWFRAQPMLWTMFGSINEP